jgi:hypothetical protein
MQHVDITVAEAEFGGDETPIPEFIFDPEDASKPVAKVVYKHTDAWRGHYDTEPLDGWKRVGEGANCGDWEDAPPGTSNREVEEYVAKLEAEHETVLVIALPTSNVFSTAFDVLARDE